MAGAVAAAKSGDSLSPQCDMASDLALHPNRPVGCVDGLYLDVGFPEEVVDVPVGHSAFPSAGLYVPPKSRDEAVQCGSNVDVAPLWERDYPEGAHTDIRVLPDFDAEAVASPYNHDGETAYCANKWATLGAG